ncbi:MAG: insulinase family protein [Chitinivibrionales bacterium]|nr:insulinase family protein [Chitinivibrionales bacterium]MBD3395873.1 insulinase family protein [Chitinivibrionales bacterium]
MVPFTRDGNRKPCGPPSCILALMTTRKIFLSVIAFASLPAMAAETFDINVPVHYDTLGNGLRMIVVPDTNVAVVSCRLYYFVGSMYEGPGTSGLSHMFEHMMFKGTKHLGTTDYRKERRIMEQIDSVAARMRELLDAGASESDPAVQAHRDSIFSLLAKQRTYIRKDAIWETYLNNGGTHLNAWTADDMTAYIVTLPMNKVELFYWIESDRMKNPVLREFYSERDVVTEERRMRYDNRPLGRYFERLWALFYVAHPYRIPTIGWMSDIRAYTREKLHDHVRRFYTPDNAVIVLVGNIEPAGAMRDIKRYFGGIPRAATPKKEVVTREPAPIGETRLMVRDDAQGRIDMFFHTPGYGHRDLYALDVVENVLSGRSGRLYRRLVTEEDLCTEAGASNAFRLHDGYFHVWAKLKGESDPAAVEAIMHEEIAALAARPPRKHEMERVKNSIRMSFASRLTSLEGISDQLAWFERLGSYRDMLQYPAEIASVNAPDVPPVVAAYLKPGHQTIGVLEPAQAASAAPREAGAFNPHREH